MAWRKIIYKISVWLAIELLRLGFNYLDVNKDGSLSKTEIKTRAKEIREIIKGL